MRIISKFHDYYDSALAYGLDPSRLYSRVPEFRTFELRFWPGSREVLPLPFRLFWGRPLEIRSLTLGFCGRHYPLWTDASWKFDIDSLVSHDKERRWRSLEEAREIERTASTKRTAWNRFVEEDSHRMSRAMGAHERKIRQAPEDSTVFRAFGCPIYVLAATGSGYGYSFVTHVHIVTNPRLANLGFERVLDPFTAFQMVATYLDNELASAESGPNTVGGDEVVARSKGFDEQSFRTAAPGQKKLNRKANRARKRSGE